ncbi:MAG: hypothetical protein ACOX3U_04715 [Christensenellales bacterium]|jgi:hypothetical protein
MINIIYGAKGTGKTKQIIDRANNSVENAKGNIVFLTDKRGYTYQISYAIRLIMMEEYELISDFDFTGFIKGLIAGDSDIEHFFIDGLHRICKKEIKELGELFQTFEQIDEKYNIDFTLAISLPREELPEFMLKYIKE